MTALLMIQHLPHEHDGVLGEALQLAGAQVTRIRCWAEPIPTSAEGYDALIVLGGDMNTDQDDRWPHLRAVRGLLASTLADGMPALGLCLGAQLLAEAAGGTVTHGTPEIGWPAIHHTAAGAADAVLSALPSGSELFNAHADYIAVPSGATILAHSEAAPVHAYRIGSGLGLQFHAEIDASYVAGYVGADGVEAYLRANGWTPEDLVDEARRRNVQHRALGLQLFAAWLADVASGRTDAADPGRA